jgi:hypothetical protein
VSVASNVFESDGDLEGSAGITDSSCPRLVSYQPVCGDAALALGTPAGNFGLVGAPPARSAGEEREVNGNEPAWLVLRAQILAERDVDHVGAGHDLPVPDEDS